MSNLGTQQYLENLSKVPGATSNIKFGRNPTIGTSAELINDLATTSYTYTTSAATYYISSSSGSDTDQTIAVVGLDANWDEQTATVSLAGQTKTALSGTWMRVYRVYNTTGSDAVGDIYVYEDDTVTAGVPQTASKIRAKILIGNGQTEMAQLTVPAGYNMIVTDFLMSSGDDKQANVYARIKPATASAPWRKIFNHDFYRSVIQESPQIPWIIPEKTDIEVWESLSTGTGPISVSWGYILEPTS